MSKQIIATVVAALILFFWQFLSWGVLNLHGGEISYTPNQDKIIQVLSENLNEAGQYRVPAGATAEEYQAVMDANAGKPWATINYQPQQSTAFGMNLFRGIVIDLLSAFLLVWILMKFADLNFMNALLGALAVGAIGYMTIPYMNSIWFQTTTMGYIADLIGWGIVGAWLGYYLPKAKN